MVEVNPNSFYFLVNKKWLEGVTSVTFLSGRDYIVAL